MPARPSGWRMWAPTRCSTCPRPQVRRSVVTGTALIVAGVLPGFLTASLATRIRDDFSFGDSTLGLAVAIFYLICTAFSTPSGHLVERIGARRGMLLGAALTATSCLAVA